MKYIMPSRRSKTDSVMRDLWPVARANRVVLYVANQVTTMTIRSDAMRHVRLMTVTAKKLSSTRHESRVGRSPYNYTRNVSRVPLDLHHDDD